MGDLSKLTNDAFAERLEHFWHAHDASPCNICKVMNEAADRLRARELPTTEAGSPSEAKTRVETTDEMVDTFLNVFQPQEGNTTILILRQRDRVRAALEAALREANRV